MKSAIRLIAATAVAAATLAMSAASAAPQVIADQNDAVQIRRSSGYLLANNEFDAFATSYLLENGQRIKFTQRVARYYVQLEHEPRVELLPQEHGVFMTANGARVQFREEGEIVAIRDFDKLSLDSRLPQGAAMLAQR